MRLRTGGGYVGSDPQTKNHWKSLYRARARVRVRVRARVRASLVWGALLLDLTFHFLLYDRDRIWLLHWLRLGEGTQG